MRDVKTIDDVEPFFQEVLGVWELLRRYGYEAADIDVVYNPRTRDVYVNVKNQGGVRVGHFGSNEEKFIEGWQAVCKWVPGACESELQQIWERSHAKRQGVLILRNLRHGDISPKVLH